jgi:predicted RNase H-related nuclease YkuK (DUF458 family)
MKKYLQNITSGKVTWKQLGTEIRDFILTEPEAKYQLIIGSDSRSKDVKTKPCIDLVTAVVIHRKGTGGRYFWSKEKIDNIYSLKEKLYQETIASLEAARKLLDILKEDLNGHYEELEIHIDVGENGPSRQMIKELVGMVNGNGFKAKVKPSAYAAASVADKYT